jgi:hypothetical protein
MSTGRPIENVGLRSVGDGLSRPCRSRWDARRSGISYLNLASLLTGSLGTALNDDGTPELTR